jgi:hypothetical protein
VKVFAKNFRFSDSFLENVCENENFRVSFRVRESFRENLSNNSELVAAPSDQAAHG